MAKSPPAASSPSSKSSTDDAELDPQSQDLGNIVHLEHLNLEVPDGQHADIFYADALGLSEDAAMLGHPRVTWYNIGRQQFHIAKASTSQKTPLPVKLILPDLADLHARLVSAQPKLNGTSFAFSQPDSNVMAVTDPWGQQFLISGPTSGSVLTEGIKEITLPCAPGTAESIGAFYQQVYKARVVNGRQSGAACSSVIAGPGTAVTFLESQQYKHAADAIKSFKGWHIAFYLADFSSVFNAVNDLGLNLLKHRYSDKAPTLQDALKCSQFRMSDIIALQDGPSSVENCCNAGDVLYSFGHELPSLFHPRFMRSLMPRS